MAILICEDNKLAARALSAVLLREGLQTETASDGNEAMFCLDNNDYDLIIADIHLPYHSGLELVRHLRKDLGKDTPVIVVSAFSDLQMQKQAKELGANEYIVKPVDMKDIAGRVRSYLVSKL
jgi:DNA-binding response OmpR family regulator